MPDAGEEAGDTSADQTDIQLWRSLRNALAASLRDRSVALNEAEITFVTRFFLETIEQRGLRIVPVKPTRKMHLAIRHALDEGKRLSLKWVQARTKQRWRYAAAIEAAPDWRRGFEAEQAGDADEGLPESQDTSETNDGDRR